jgi:hypothetical protein
MRDTFKSMAYTILKEAGRPLHSVEITSRARRKGFDPGGRTPAATMAAVLYVDTNKKGDGSAFIKTGASTFGLNPKYRTEASALAQLDAASYPLSPNVSSKQKGDIAEARVAELVTLYGRRPLSSYRPISDDEGIDLIVKTKGALGQAVHLQVKSRFGPVTGKLFTATTKPPADVDGHLAFVFCHFDTDEGDLWRYLWFVPGSDFISGANKLSNGWLGFVASMNPSGKHGGQPTKWSEFVIDKRGLADSILELMDRPRTRYSRRNVARRVAQGGRRRAD